MRGRSIEAEIRIFERPGAARKQPGTRPRETTGPICPTRATEAAARASPTTTIGDSPNHHGTRRPGVEAAEARGKGRATVTAMTTTQKEVTSASCMRPRRRVFRPDGVQSAAAGDGMTIGFQGGQELGQKHGSASASGGTRQECACKCCGPTGRRSSCRGPLRRHAIWHQQFTFFGVLLFIIGSTQ